MRGSLLRLCARWGEGTLQQGLVPRTVPPAPPAARGDVERLQALLDSSLRLVALTGAGLSTESGIPDYRSAGVGLYARTARRPVQYQDFLRDPRARQRYWARNYVGWARFSGSTPNCAHFALSEWERAGRLDHIVTQNVDELHRKAGSERVVELHGSTHRVVCLGCGARTSRWDLQALLTAANRDWVGADVDASEVAPDGDVLLTDELVNNFHVPPCAQCGGVLKPDVIFFGDNVASSVVDRVYALVDQCDCLLVLGSSLYVYSGYRFVVRAQSLGKRVSIVNIGPTRADHLCELKVDARCGDVLSQIHLH